MHKTTEGLPLSVLHGKLNAASKECLKVRIRQTTLFICSDLRKNEARSTIELEVSGALVFLRLLFVVFAGNQIILTKLKLLRTECWKKASHKLVF